MKAELENTYQAALVVATWIIRLAVILTVAAGVVLALGALVATLAVLLVVALVWGSVWGLTVALRFLASRLAPLEPELEAAA